jgi:hypothetical protein
MRHKATSNLAAQALSRSDDGSGINAESLIAALGEHPHIHSLVDSLRDTEFYQKIASDRI